MASSSADLSRFVAAQLSTFYPDRQLAAEELAPHVEVALARHARCVAGVGIKGASAALDVLHTDQYATFLYFLANTLHRSGELDLAAKSYALNKALHCVDIFYEVELPEVFALQHPVGTVIGRGTFADHLFVYQRCSIGSSVGGHYPRLEQGVVMFGGSGIIGRCHVGPNTWLSVGALVMDQDVPGDCIVFGRSPQLVIKPTRRNVRRDMFKLP